MKYIVTQPNKNARLGHQFHNWSLGLVVSKLYGLEFVHTPFYGKSSKWEKVFNFGKNFRVKNDLSNVVNLPKIELGHNPNFNLNIAKNNLGVWGDIINNGEDETLFVVPYDSFPGFLSENIIEWSPYLKECYWEDKVKYKFDTNYLNIGLHIRRGDISKEGNKNRWLELSTYNNVMGYLRNKYQDKNIKFHIFSEGQEHYFSELVHDDVKLHLDGSDVEAFRMLSSVDILVTGLSTFSILSAYITDAPVYYFPLMNFTRWDSVYNYKNIEYILEKQ